MKTAKNSEQKLDPIPLMNLGTSKKTRGRPRKTPISSNSSKFTLQLFPIDKKTRIGLEMDHCYPYLQLTISMRKRIVSVLRRLNSKFSASRLAHGDPILLPYYQSRESNNFIWTLDDCKTTAEDIFAAFGRPAVLRLRYGWTNKEELVSKKDESLTDFAASLEELINTDSTKDGQLHEENLQPSTNSNADENLSREHYGQQEASGEQNLVNWEDNLTNISVGDLLSEASLQAILACGSKVYGNPNEMQGKQLGPNSFEAQVASEAKFSPETSSYLFDGEDTCNAFSFNQSCIQSDGVNDAVPGFVNDENSLGLSGIKWNDSMSGYELGYFNRKVFGEESLSLGKIIF